MAVKVLGWFLFPAAALAVVLLVGPALAAADLARPHAAAVQRAAECETAGIVPGSVVVVSTSNRAGAVSGHSIKFQLCPYPDRAAAAGSEAGPPAYPDSISLLWDQFYLHRPEEKGIVLTAAGAGKSWPAAAPYRPRPCYATLQGEGVSVKFAAADNLNTLIPAADRNIPITLQFAIPETAGMINPFFTDEYRWSIALHYDRGDYGNAYATAVNMPIVAPPLTSTASIRLSQNSGPPGTTVTIVGHGFPPLSPVQSVQVDWIAVAPEDPASTNDMGQFRLDILIPGLENGVRTIRVRVAGIPIAIRFIIQGPNIGPLDTPTADALRDLGDNLVRVFHFSPRSNHWTFYDPEVPEVSTLTYFDYWECYWLLVKEPAEVILGRQIRNLTCRPDGKCWHFIVW